MIKILNSFILITLISFEVNACFFEIGDTSRTEMTWNERVMEYKSEVQRIKRDGERINDIFSIFDLITIEELYEELKTRIINAEKALDELESNETDSKKNEFYRVYESMLYSYDELIKLYDFYKQLENKKEEWSNEYFRLWEQTYAMKTRIDDLYIKEEKMNVHYGGMNDYKYQSIRKRNLYEACSNIFNSGLLQLRSTGDCDHYERILILSKLLPVMRKCEKLSYTDNTRMLERELKREDEVQIMSEMILNFEFSE